MKRLALISLIIGTALALVPVASSMVLSDGGGSGGGIAAAPGGVDPATQAVLLRSKALAQYYDTGAVVTSPANTPLTGKALSAFYDTGAMVTSGSAQPTSGATSQPVDPATQAVLLRSKGLADYYGANGVTFHTDVLGGERRPSAAPRLRPATRSTGARSGGNARRDAPPRGRGDRDHEAEAQPQLLSSSSTGEATSGPHGPLVVGARAPFRLARLPGGLSLGTPNRYRRWGDEEAPSRTGGARDVGRCWTARVRQIRPAPATSSACPGRTTSVAAPGTPATEINTVRR